MKGCDYIVNTISTHPLNLDRESIDMYNKLNERCPECIERFKNKDLNKEILHILFDSVFPEVPNLDFKLSNDNALITYFESIEEIFKKELSKNIPIFNGSYKIIIVIDKQVQKIEITPKVFKVLSTVFNIEGRFFNEINAIIEIQDKFLSNLYALNNDIEVVKLLESEKNENMTNQKKEILGTLINYLKCL